MGEDNLSFEGVHYPKVPVVRTPNYEICFEQFDVHTFIHARVFGKWTPEVKRAFARDLDLALELHGGPLLVLCARSNTKLRKFATQFDFEHALYLDQKDGVASEILIRKNKNGRPLPVLEGPAV